MKITYDAGTDAPIAESDVDRTGVILDFDEEGEVVAFEILDASRRVTDPRHVEFTAVA